MNTTQTGFAVCMQRAGRSVLITEQARTVSAQHVCDNNRTSAAKCHHALRTCRGLSWRMMTPACEASPQLEHCCVCSTSRTCFKWRYTAFCSNGYERALLAVRRVRRLTNCRLVRGLAREGSCTAAMVRTNEPYAPSKMTVVTGITIVVVVLPLPRKTPVPAPVRPMGMLRDDVEV